MFYREDEGETFDDFLDVGGDFGVIFEVVPWMHESFLGIYSPLKPVLS